MDFTVEKIVQHTKLSYRQAIGMWLACASLLLLSSCDRPDNGAPASAPRSGKPQIYVDNYPLKYFAQRIGGELIDVHFPARRAIDPAFWKPGPTEIRAYQNADLILLNGADYAKWVAQASLPLAKMIDTTAAVADRYIIIQESVTHQHGPAGEHTHTGFAFTTWLDFTIAAEQAKAVHESLVKLLPDQRERLTAAFDSLSAELLAIDEQLRLLVGERHDLPLLASHPVYQYFERRYGLALRSVHWEPDVFPSESDWNELARIKTEHDARWMIWEDEPKAETADALRKLGIECVVWRPCGNEPATGDWASVMRKNLENLRPVFSD